MTALDFTITFRSPFAVATGVARDGLDTTVNVTEPLPATALKGLIRAHLRDSLGASPTQVAQIFDSGDQVRWIFSSAEFPDVVDINHWARVKVDDFGRAEERHLMVGEQAGAATASFAITWEGPGNPPEAETRALRASARCVTSLGSHRRRGMGWVSITDALPWTEKDSRCLLDWLSNEGSR
ncbi:MAG: hypothetical protein ACK5LN_03860 [Propioniciclava sp.]